jgi:hypothetical protein
VSFRLLCLIAGTVGMPISLVCLIPGGVPAGCTEQEGTYHDAPGYQGGSFEHVAAIYLEFHGLLVLMG